MIVRKKIGTFVLTTVGMFMISGFSSCFTTPPLPAPSEAGFFIVTEFQPFGSPLPLLVPVVTTHWDFLRDQTGLTAIGDSTSFDNTTDISQAKGIAANKRVPSVWGGQWLKGGPPECIGAPDAPGLSFNSNPQRVTEVICLQGAPGLDSLMAAGNFTLTPHPMYTDGSSGGTVTVRGAGFSAQYGMPLVQYVDSNGTLVAQTTFSSVAPDGTWASAVAPDVSQVNLGSYSGVIYNANSSGGYNFLGAVAVTVLDPPPDPGTGCTGHPRPLNCN